MFCSQSCYCFPIILDSVNEFVSAKTDPMIPVYEFLTWFSHARPAEPWPMVPLISVSLSLSIFFWLTLLLAEAKGDMDLAASRGGSGTKLFWIHGQAGILKFLIARFKFCYTGKRQWFDGDTMNHWEQASSPSIEVAPQTNTIGGLAIWCYVPAPTCKTTLLLNTIAFIMKEKPFKRF